MDNDTERKHGSGPTIENVASAAGVSIRTVSRVLNGSEQVNAETREKVLGIIATLDYRPSPRARALAMGRSFLIGMVHNDRNALVLDPIQRGIVARAAQRGYELVVHPAPLETGPAVSDVMAFVSRSRVDGLVVMPPISGNVALADRLAAAGIPAVALSAVERPGFQDVIVSPERAAAAEVARYLLGLGHRRLGIVNGPGNTASASERRRGFLDEAARWPDATVAESAGEYDFASGVAAAEHLLALPLRPTAIFAANDVMAAGILKIAARMGVPVPEQLSVVGFDGSLVTRMLSPALTSVVRPFADMASAATDRLLDAIEGKPPTPAAAIPLVLAEAESSGPAPA